VHRTLWYVAASLALVGALLIPGAAPAQANNWGGGVSDTGCDSDISRGDGAAYFFYYEGVNDPMREATNHIRNTELDPTDINTSVDNSSDEETDVVVHQDNYGDGNAYCGYNWHPNGIIGLATCRSQNAANSCRRHDTWYDSSWTSAHGTAAQRALACHETGHAVGLQHWGPDCLADPIVTSQNSLDGHAVNHINNNY